MKQTDRILNRVYPLHQHVNQIIVDSAREFFTIIQSVKVPAALPITIKNNIIRPLSQR